jgi:addiction module HigA family antidote
MKKQTILVPGDVLKDLLDEYQIHISQLANDIGLSVSAVRQIVANKAKISLHIAKRLSKYFNTTVAYWVELQNAFDLAELEKDTELTEIIKNIPKAKKASPPKEAKEAKKAAPRRSRKDAAQDASDKPKRPRARRVKEEVVVEE